MLWCGVRCCWQARVHLHLHKCMHSPPCDSQVKDEAQAAAAAAANNGSNNPFQQLLAQAGKAEPKAEGEGQAGAGAGDVEMKDAAASAAQPPNQGAQPMEVEAGPGGHAKAAATAEAGAASTAPPPTPKPLAGGHHPQGSAAPGSGGPHTPLASPDIKARMAELARLTPASRLQALQREERVASGGEEGEAGEGGAGSAAAGAGSESGLGVLGSAGKGSEKLRPLETVALGMDRPVTAETKAIHKWIDRVLLPCALRCVSTRVRSAWLGSPGVWRLEVLAAPGA